MPRRSLALAFALFLFCVPTLARATSPACCFATQQQITRPAGLECLEVALLISCGDSTIRNNCAFPVELRGWPGLTSSGRGLPSDIADRTLQPGESVLFVISASRLRAHVSRQLSVSAMGEEQAIGIDYDPVCPEPGEDSFLPGCSTTGSPREATAGWSFLFVAALIGVTAVRRRAEGERA
jgi:hypothetical protein